MQWIISAYMLSLGSFSSSVGGIAVISNAFDDRARAITAITNRRRKNH